MTKLQRLLIKTSFLLLSNTGFQQALAATFELPQNGDSVIGHVQITQAQRGDTFSSISRRYDFGYYELVEANPSLNPEQLQPGALVVLPTQFILPDAPRTGIVVNLAELRLYYYPSTTHTVITFPVGIGREGSGTLLGLTKVLKKTINPIWRPTPDTLAADAKNHIAVPRSVPPGPDNPLGAYALWFHPTYLMHGTNDYTSIGRRSSAGCIHLLPEDIEAIFDKIKTGTAVNVISVAYKTGWLDEKLYLEAHVPLQEEQRTAYINTAMLNDVINVAIQTKPTTQVNWPMAKKIANSQTGIPQLIGVLPSAPNPTVDLTSQQTNNTNH